MLAPGDYSDALRALGRFFEDAEASEISIRDRAEVLEISWRGNRGLRARRIYTTEQISALRIAARMYRGIKDVEPRLGTEELLRTLGRLLDEAQAREVHILQKPDAFLVSSRGGEVKREFSLDELIARAKEDQARRTAEPAPRDEAP